MAAGLRAPIAVVLVLAMAGCRAGASTAASAGPEEPGLSASAAAGATAPVLAPSETEASRAPADVAPSVPSEARVVEADTPLLVEALADPERSRDAALALARLGTPAAAKALARHAVAGDPLEAIAVAGLGWHGGHVHADRLLAALRSPDPETRAAAARAVGAAATADWARPLALALAEQPAPVKVAVLDAVGLARLRELAPDVAAASRHADPAVRAAAVQALARLPVGAAPYLIEERTADPDPTVASAAREASSPAPPEGDRAAAPAPCPALPADAPALLALLADPDASVHERALAAVSLARTSPSGTAHGAAVPSDWPRLVRVTALLARERLGYPVRPSDADLARRALEFARWAHPDMERRLDACVDAALVGLAPTPGDVPTPTAP